MLASYLKLHAIKQKDFARKIGVTDGYLSALISGSKTPSLAVAVTIERATGGAVPSASWLNDDEEDAA